MGLDENNRKAKFSLCYALNCANTRVEGIVNSNQRDITYLNFHVIKLKFVFFFSFRNIATLTNIINAVT